MNVTVTGASGHVGTNLVLGLLARGDRVRALVHRSVEPFEGLDVERLRGDVRDAHAVERAVAGSEIVYHLASIISIDGGQGGRVASVNVDGTRNVARCALRGGVRRLVHCSSMHAFDQQPLAQPLDEERAQVTHGPAYDRSKALGEREVGSAIQDGLDAVIVNPTAVVGPNDFGPSRVGQLLLDLKRRGLVALVQGGVDWVDVRDVADGLIAAGRLGRSGENYILSGHWHSMRELAAMAEAVTGVPAPRLVVPMPLARLVAPLATAVGRFGKREPAFTSEALRALRSNGSILHDKATRELAYRPRPIAESIRDSYAWFGAGHES